LWHLKACGHKQIAFGRSSGLCRKPELLYIYTLHIRLLASNGGVYRISYQFVCSIAAELLTLYFRFRETV